MEFNSSEKPLVFQKRTDKELKVGRFDAKVCALLYLRALRLCESFFIASNLDGAWPFDDIVLVWRTRGDDSGRYRACLVHTKHSQQDGGVDTVRAGTQGELYLEKYANALPVLAPLWSHDVVYAMYTDGAVLGGDGGEPTGQLGGLEELLATTGGGATTLRRDARLLRALAERLPDPALAREFLDKFVLFQRQASSLELESLIQDELRRLLGTAINDTYNAYSQLMFGIEQWWLADTECCYLTETTELIPDIKRKVELLLETDRVNQSTQSKYLNRYGKKSSSVLDTFAKDSRSLFTRTNSEPQGKMMSAGRQLSEKDSRSSFSRTDSEPQGQMISAGRQLSEKDSRSSFSRTDSEPQGQLKVTLAPVTIRNTVQQIPSTKSQNSKVVSSNGTETYKSSVTSRKSPGIALKRWYSVANFDENSRDDGKKTLDKSLELSKVNQFTNKTSWYHTLKAYSSRSRNYREVQGDAGNTPEGTNHDDLSARASSNKDTAQPAAPSSPDHRLTKTGASEPNLSQDNNSEREQQSQNNLERPPKPQVPPRPIQSNLKLAGFNSEARGYIDGLRNSPRPDTKGLASSGNSSTLPVRRQRIISNRIRFGETSLDNTIDLTDAPSHDEEVFENGINVHNENSRREWLSNSVLGNRDDLGTPHLDTDLARKVVRSMSLSTPNLLQEANVTTHEPNVVTSNMRERLARSVKHFAPLSFRPRSLISQDSFDEE